MGNELNKNLTGNWVAYAKMPSIFPKFCHSSEKILSSVHFVYENLVGATYPRNEMEWGGKPAYA